MILLQATTGSMKCSPRASLPITQSKLQMTPGIISGLVEKPTRKWKKSRRGHLVAGLRLSLIIEPVADLPRHPLPLAHHRVDNGPSKSVAGEPKCQSTR
jgi:hypothetical protein